MKNLTLLISSLLAAGLLSTSALAAEMTPKAQYDAAKKQAAARWTEDKKLCAEEASSSARMQCQRDAKTVYTEALAKAKAEMDQAAKAAKSATPCGADCGKVASVDVSEKEGDAGAAGIIAGGVAGALLGHQVGKGTGKDIATVAGAAGGAYAGHKIEQKMKATKVWAVSVQYDNGNKKTFNFDKDPGLKAGDLVRNSGESIAKR